MDMVIRLFNLLTFVAAVLALFGLCYTIWLDREGFTIWELVFLAVIFLGMTGPIIWQTGKWIASGPQKISVVWLVAFWLWLMVIYAMILVGGMARIGFTVG